MDQVTMTILMLVVCFGLMYFLTIRPQKKKEVQQTPGQMTLFDVFSGQTISDQQSEIVTTKPTGDIIPTTHPQITGVQEQLAYTSRQNQMQQTNDTTALVQSGLTMSQTSDIESQLRSNIVESSKTESAEYLCSGRYV